MIHFIDDFHSSMSKEEKNSKKHSTTSFNNDNVKCRQKKA